MATRASQKARKKVASLKTRASAKSPRKVPKQHPPKGIERDYIRRLQSFAISREDLRPLMKALPELLRSSRKELLRTDCVRYDNGESKIASGIIADILEDKRLPSPFLERVVQTFAGRTEAHQKVQMTRQVKAGLGVNLPIKDGPLSLVRENFVQENISLIKNLPTKTMSEIEGIVMRGLSGGQLHTDIAKDIYERTAIGQKRAKLIARDQVGKYYGAVSSTRHQATGFTRFTWQTVEDRRVRDEHQNISGDVFTYKTGAPGVGLPGQPILCRCFPDPVFDDLLD